MSGNSSSCRVVTSPVPKVKLKTRNALSEPLETHSLPLTPRPSLRPPNLDLSALPISCPHSICSLLLTSSLTAVLMVSLVKFCCCQGQTFGYTHEHNHILHAHRITRRFMLQFQPHDNLQACVPGCPQTFPASQEALPVFMSLQLQWLRWRWLGDRAVGGGQARLGQRAVLGHRAVLLGHGALLLRAGGRSGAAELCVGKQSSRGGQRGRDRGQEATAAVTLPPHMHKALVVCVSARLQTAG